MSTSFYHIGFGLDDLGPEPATLALLSGDPNRATMIARERLTDARVLSENRGLNSYVARLPGGRPVISATSGMGAPSLSIVVNELIQFGVRTIIRIGTCGSIQASVAPGAIVISGSASITSASMLASTSSSQARKRSNATDVLVNTGISASRK